MSPTFVSNRAIKFVNPVLGSSGRTWNFALPLQKIIFRYCNPSPDKIFCWVLCYAPPRAGALSDDAVWRLTSVCLSVAYIGAKSRTERRRKTIGTDKLVIFSYCLSLGWINVVCISFFHTWPDTTFKVKRSNFKVTGAGILWRPPAQLVKYACTRRSVLYIHT